MIADCCNVCGDGLEPHMADVRDPLTGELFSVLRCRQCGLGHTTPQPEDLGRYYAVQYYGNRHGFTMRYCMRRRLKFVSVALQGLAKGNNILDIGCGDGSFLLMARDAGWEVMGTELNPGPGRAAGVDVWESVEEITGAGICDCITMWHTLEHMRDIPFTLKHVGRLLKPDGRLIVAVPDWGGLQARIFGRHWLHVDVPRHLYHFDANSLDFCLSSAGFTIERRWHQELEYDLLGWSQSAFNSLAPSHPNLFFDALTGKRRTLGLVAGLGVFFLGSILTLLSLPALATGTLLGLGGSLIVVARKADGTSKSS